MTLATSYGKGCVFLRTGLKPLSWSLLRGLALWWWSFAAFRSNQNVEDISCVAAVTHEEPEVQRKR